MNLQPRQQIYKHGWHLLLHVEVLSSRSQCLLKKKQEKFVMTVRGYWDRDCSLYRSLIYLWGFHDLLTNTKYLTALNKLKIMSEVAHGN